MKIKIYLATLLVASIAASRPLASAGLASTHVNGPLPAPGDSPSILASGPGEPPLCRPGQPCVTGSLSAGIGESSHALTFGAGHSKES
jgi:hypothetical protein